MQEIAHNMENSAYSGDVSHICNSIFKKIKIYRNFVISFYFVIRYEINLFDLILHVYTQQKMQFIFNKQIIIDIF